MSKERILEREERWATSAAACAFGAAVLFIAATIAAQSGVVAASTETEFLREFEANRGTMLLASALNFLALALFAPVLVYLFRAAAARSEVVRGGLVGVVAAGPIFFGIANLSQYAAFSVAASDFATPGGGAGIPVGEYAEDLIRDQTVFGVAQGFGFAGIIAMVFGVVYTCLWAMRVGLLTRFFATFGMALGASLILLAQAFSLLALMFWGAWLGLVILGRTPRGRPAAWDAGEAVPWPRPGDEPAEPDERDVEGEATELFANASNGDGENPNAARRERAKRRKRKRRR